MTEITISENIIETNGKVFLYGLIITIVEIPIIYFFIWKKILKNIAESLAYDEKQIPLCGFFSFLALPIIMSWPLQPRSRGSTLPPGCWSSCAASFPTRP